MNNANVDDCTFVPDKNRQSVVDHDPVEEIVFTIKGSHDYTYEDIPALHDHKGVRAPERLDACAKKVGSNYYIKISRGEIFNPMNPAHIRNSNKKDGGEFIWKYQRVPYLAFAHYAYFLRTKNGSFLDLASREVISL